MLSLRLSFFAASIVIASATFNTLPVVAEAHRPCKAQSILHADDSFRHTGGSFDETACYRLEVHEAGLLMLDIAAPENAVRLDLQGRQGLDVLARSASEFLVDVQPGAYLVEVRAEDPAQPLPAHRLTSRLLPVSKSETNGELELEPEKSETNGELELEPEKSETNGELELEPEKFAALPSPFACGPTTKSETNGELELEPEKSETNGELELEPEKSETNGELELEPEKADACAAIRPLLERLCHRGTDELDDHGDSLACAGTIEGLAYGEIRNGWGDDADVFRFEIAEWQTVEILAGGDITPRLTLTDARGQSLGSSEHGRFVQTLGPGLYFLRLGAPFETGAYQVEIRKVVR